MNFADLYRYVNADLDARSVPFRALRERVCAFHPHVGGVETVPAPLNPEIAIGYMLYEEDRTSPYEDTFDVALIRYSDQLNRCWRRLVCSKELMHVFDRSVGRTNTRERFMMLLGELETGTLYEDASEMVKSERDALWMALLTLCPERLYKAYLRRAMSSDEIAAAANALKIPVQAVRAVMHPYYWTALETLTGEVGEQPH